MSIWVGKDTRLLVQGLTGREGTFHALACREYGTQVVAGVTPGKGGTVHEGIPVFDTVADAVARDGRQRLDDLRAAAVRGRRRSSRRRTRASRVIACITEGIPTNDMIRAKAFLAAQNAAGEPVRLIGPNCPGIITPGECKIGIMPGRIHKPGHDRRHLALGNADVRGRGPADAPRRSGSRRSSASAATRSTGRASSTASQAFKDDPGTEAVVLIGEIGGMAEEEAACWVAGNLRKPVVAFIAGQTAPPGPPHGPRRRDHRGRPGHRRRQDEGARGRRHRGRPLAGRPREPDEGSPGR